MNEVKFYKKSTRKQANAKSKKQRSINNMTIRFKLLNLKNLNDLPHLQNDDVCEIFFDL